MYIYLYCRWTIESRVADSWRIMSMCNDTDVLSVCVNIKLVYKLVMYINVFDTLKKAIILLWYYNMFLWQYNNCRIMTYNMHFICWIYILSYWYPSLTQLVLIFVSCKKCQNCGGIWYESKVWIELVALVTVFWEAQSTRYWKGWDLHQFGSS